MFPNEQILNIEEYKIKLWSPSKFSDSCIYKVHRSITPFPFTSIISALIFALKNYPSSLLLHLVIFLALLLFTPAEIWVRAYGANLLPCPGVRDNHHQLQQQQQQLTSTDRPLSVSLILSHPHLFRSFRSSGDWQPNLSLSSSLVPGTGRHFA